jgi:hypothetical protein
MTSATSKSLLLGLAMAVAGCGGGTKTSAFAGLRPAPAPSSWPVARIATGAAMAYPPAWRRIVSDPGTATAALQDRERRFLGYLNVTPRQADEKLSNWAAFRVAHNADEGDTRVTTLAAATGVRFLSGRGSCVRDAYTTRSGNRFTEVACLVAGAHAMSVIVGAAPSRSWTQASQTIDRAISAFAT